MAVNNPRHSRFFWRSSAIFGILGSECEFKEVNAAWEKTLGLSTGQLLARAYMDFVHEDDRISTKHYFEQLNNGVPSVSFSNRFRHYDGSWRYILWDINSAAATEYAYYVVGLDITEREQPMISDEILSVLEEGVVLQYANGTIGACNPNAEKIIGLSAENMMGWTLIDPDWRAIREDGSPFPAETHPAICTLRTGQSYSNVVMGVIKPDDSVFWIRINTHPLWRDDVTTPYAVVISFSNVTDYKNIEQQLRKELSQRSSDTTVQMTESNYELWDWNLENNKVTFSDRWKQMLGYGQDILPNHIDTWHQRIHPADYNRVMADIQNHLKNMTPTCETRHRIQHKDGSYRWILVNAIAIRNSSGKPQRLIGTHIDITDPRRMEESLQETEKKYQQLMELESDSVFLIDAESTEILEANRIASRTYGYSRRQLIGARQVELSAQPDKMVQYFKKGIKSSFQQYHKRQDGAVFPVDVSVAPFAWRGRQVMLVICRDISDRQTIETALWESESKYRQLFEAASTPIIVFDANTQQIFDVNHAAIELYGYTKEEWVHMTTEDISAEPVKRRAAFGSTSKKGQTIPLRWHKRRDGSVFPVEIAVGNSYLFQGRSLVCATLRDITERKAAEEALRKERDFSNTLVQASPAFFFAINPDGTTRMMNQAMLNALGFELPEVVGKFYLNTFVLNNEQPMVSTEFEMLRKSMQPSLMESHVMTKQGHQLLVEWHSRAVVRADGALDFIFGVGIDVTERKKAQNHLHLFKSIVESSSESISISNAEDQLIYINTAHERLFGRSLRAAQQLSLNDYYTEESQKIVATEMLPTLKRGDGWEGELMAINQDDEMFPIWQRMDAVRDTQGNILFIFGLMHDISERKRMWDALRKQWEEQQMIFNTVPAMIWYRDSKNRLMRRNTMAQQIFGTDDKVVDMFTDCNDVLETGLPQRGILHPYPDKQGQQHWLQLDRIPYRDTQGIITGAIVFGLDITDYQSMQQDLAQDSQQLQTMMEYMPVMFVALDNDNQILYWNQTCEHVSGYSAREVVSNPEVWEMLYPENQDRQQMLTSWQTSDDNYIQWETRINCKDNSFRTVRWISVCHQYPITGWRAWYIGQDITDTQREKTSGLQQQGSSDPLIASMLSSTCLGISLTDDRGRFVQVNNAYAGLLGYRENELVGQPFTAVLPPADQSDAVREYYSLLMTHERPTVIKQRREQHRDGQILEVQVMSSRVVLEDRKRMLISIISKP